MKGRLAKKESWWAVVGAGQELRVHPNCMRDPKFSTYWVDGRAVSFEVVEECLNYGGGHLNRDCPCRGNFEQMALLKADEALPKNPEPARSPLI